MKHVIPLLVLALLMPRMALAELHDPFARELAAISVLESSSGRYKQHQVVTKGIQKGTRAGGSMGLMPQTVLYILKISNRLRLRYGFLQFMPADRISDYLNNHERADREIASYYWAKLRRELSPERSAAAWYFGLGFARNLSDESAILLPYVARFMTALQEQK